MEGEGLIVVKQLPVIEEQLRVVKTQIEDQTALALDMACTEDTVKEIKKKRAELSKQLSEFEERRKAVKKQILSPYEAFEAIYKECISDVYRNADSILKGRIKEVERVVRQQKTDEVVSYFNEYRDSLGIDFVSFPQAGIRVGLSDSKKSLKTQAKDFLDRIAGDLHLIDTQESREEILVEYKRSLNISSAILVVKERQAQIRAEQDRAAARKAEQERAQEAARKVDQAAARWTAPGKEPPVADEKESQEKLFKITFTVTGTKSQMVALRDFLKNGGYQYE